MEEYIVKASAIVNEVRKAVVGKDQVIIKALTAILARGHILIEDIPGVGKTTMAMAFAKTMSLDSKRVQFTPDVLPTDITGFSMYNRNTGKFEYKEGTVITNLFLADEINRTSSKTQSALLEVMEEGKVTVDGETRYVKDPFIVIATQNPVGSVGTHKLPESQMDRFMIMLSVGYPDKQNEINILKGRKSGEIISKLKPVVSSKDITDIRNFVNDIYISDEIYDYIINLVQQTRNNQYIELGLSTRASIALCAMTKSNAFMHGRNYAIPDDVRDVFLDVSTHRIVLSTKAKLEKKNETNILKSIRDSVKIPEIIIK